MCSQPQSYITSRISDGIGNRLFQVANSLALGRLWGLPVRFCRKQAIPSNHGSLEHFYRLFPDIPIDTDEPKEGWAAVYSPSTEATIYTYIPPPLEAPAPGPILVTGHYQSPRYFEFEPTMSPSWSSLFTEKGCNEIAAEAGLILPEERYKTWMIHFRYGDYTKLAHHQVNLNAYYIQCVYAIPACSRLHVFSDEPEKCREFLTDICSDREITVTWSKQTIDVVALYEMSLCWGGAITANSTFSWWGAWLAKQASESASYKAYYPSCWGVGLPDPVDIVPSQWGEKVRVTL